MSVMNNFEASSVSSYGDPSLDLIPANFDPEAALYSQDFVDGLDDYFSSPVEEVAYPILDNVSNELIPKVTLAETWELRDVQRLAPLDLAVNSPKLKNFKKRITHPLNLAMESRGTLVYVFSKDHDQRRKEDAIRVINHVKYTHSVVFLEVDDPSKEIPEVLIKTVLQTQQKIEGLILNCHGNEDALRFPLGPYKVEDLQVEKWENYLAPKCPIILISCYVGKNLAGNLAQRIHRFVYAPISLCIRNKVEINFSRVRETICMEAPENNVRLFSPEGGVTPLSKDPLFQEALDRLERDPRSSDLYYLADHHWLGRHFSTYNECVPILYENLAYLCKEQEKICQQDATFPSPANVPYKEILDEIILLSTETEELYKQVIEEIFSSPSSSFWFSLSTMLKWAEREDLTQICAYLGCKVQEHKGL